MRKPVKIILSYILLFSFISCSKEKDTGVQTVLKGHVSDNTRGINISGYKIVLVKSWRFCANWMCGTKSEEVATAYTDDNGDYSIRFKYKLNPGESYSFREQYYGIPYYPEYLSPIEITAGKTNTVNINAWKPLALTLNVEVLNNNNPSLNVRSEFGNSKTLDGTEFIYEQNINKTFTLRSKPNSNINIIFWYYTGSNASPALHQKIIPFQTTLEDMTSLNFTIDCSTF